MARTNENGEQVEKRELTAGEIFDQSAKIVAARARDLNKAVKDWKNGDAELEDLILEVQLGQRKLNKAIANFATASKAVTGK